MSFIAGAGITNVDLLYQNMPKLPDVGEEVYTDTFSLQLGGGMPATLINLGRLGVPTRIATELGDDLFSGFAKTQFEKNGVSPCNLYHGDGIPVNITSAVILKNDRSFITYGKGDMQPDDKAKEAFIPPEFLIPDSIREPLFPVFLRRCTVSDDWFDVEPDNVPNPLLN